MRPIRRSGPPPHHRDKRPTLREQSLTKKHSRRLHQQSPHPTYHPRLRPSRSQPARNPALLIHSRIPLHAIQISKHTSSMIIPLHRNHRPAILSRQPCRNPGQLQRPQPLLQLRALHPGLSLDHLHCRKVSIWPTPSRIHRHDILLTRNRRQPNLQRPTSPRLQRLTHGSQSLLHSLNFKAALPRSLEAALRILRKLLRPQPPITSLQPATKSNLPRSQTMRRHQPKLILAHLLNRSANISLLHPPRKKVPHNVTRRTSIRSRPSPLLIKTSIGPIRRRLHHHLASRRQRRPQPSQRSRRISRPPAHLTAMQILHRQPTPCILIPRADHAKLTIQRRKTHLSSIRLTPSQRTLAQLHRQTLPESLHHPKDSLCRLPRLRHLHRHHAASSNRLQKKSSSHPGRNPHLPGLQHNILPAAFTFKRKLHSIGSQRPLQTRTIPNPQPTLSHPHQSRRLLIHPPANRQQIFYIPLSFTHSANLIILKDDGAPRLRGRLRPSFFKPLPAFAS